jgi:phage-related protein
MNMKLLSFRGSSLNDLRLFPQEARQDAGYQLYQVQMGRDPQDFKPMTTGGAGVYEIRVTDDTGTYRVMYVAKFNESVYVLHCFQKKSQKTKKEDLILAQKRYRELLQEVQR